jgi:hypothetical protein
MKEPGGVRSNATQTDVEMQVAMSKRTGSTVQTKIRWASFRDLVDPIIEGTVIERGVLRFSVP